MPTGQVPAVVLGTPYGPAEPPVAAPPLAQHDLPGLQPHPVPPRPVAHDLSPLCRPRGCVGAHALISRELGPHREVPLDHTVQTPCLILAEIISHQHGQILDLLVRQVHRHDPSLTSGRSNTAPRAALSACSHTPPSVSGRVPGSGHMTRRSASSGRSMDHRRVTMSNHHAVPPLACRGMSPDRIMSGV